MHVKKDAPPFCRKEMTRSSASFVWRSGRVLFLRGVRCAWRKEICPAEQVRPKLLDRRVVADGVVFN